MPNPILDQERVAFLAARQVIRKVLLPAWPRQIKELPMVEVEVEWVRFSTLNHRTRAEQLRAIHLAKQPDLFSSDPLGEKAQQAQYEILKSQEGFDELKEDLQERGQQDPAVVTAEGVLINGNRRAAALRSLYKEDNQLAARYIQCLVLPDDASTPELVDLEAELQVARDFKEGYSWVNEALLIEELLDRDGKDFARVAKRMHRDTNSVKHYYEKLQQLHQLVALSRGTRLHIDFKENESAFDELVKHIRAKSNTEAQSVQSTYFLGTLTDVNYRTLRHLRRPNAAQLVMREVNRDPALKPVLDTITGAHSEKNSGDPLDDLLGDADGPNQVTDILRFLASQQRDDVISLEGGATVSANDVYRSIHNAISCAAAEAEEDSRDAGAVTAPLARTDKAILELERAIAALPKARRYAEWNENEFQKKIVRLRALIDATPLAQ